jgi:hypothetical protein
MKELEQLSNDFVKTTKRFAAELEKKRAALQVEAELVLRAITQNFFNKHEQALCLTWTQSIPSFNDGEPCEFGLGDVFHVCKTDITEDRDLEEVINYEGSCIPSTKEFLYTEFLVKSVEQSLQYTASWLEQVDKYRDSLDMHTLSDYAKKRLIDYIENGDMLKEYEQNNKYLAVFGSLDNMNTYTKDVEAFVSFIISIPEEVIQNIFGSNARVTIYKDKVEVEEYDCGY